MMRASRLLVLCACAAAAAQLWAGGGNVGVAPGLHTFSGDITEWPVPTPKYARDPAVGTDGRIYFASSMGEKIARFDPKTKRFDEWNLAPGARPRGVAVLKDGTVIFADPAHKSIGELNPVSGKLKQYPIQGGAGDPYTLTLENQNRVWFTIKSAGQVVMLDRINGSMNVYRVADDPYGISIDRLGNAWVTHRSADRISRIDAKTGQVREIALPKGTQPRRTVITIDGMLWVSLYGVGKLLKLDTASGNIVKEYDMPGGPNGGPYAVNADAGGRVWISEIQTDNVVMFNPRSETMRVFKLPSKNTGIRKATFDGDGRYWYIGSHIEKLGVIE